MERIKVRCKYCDREISKSNMARHEQACAVKDKTVKVSYRLDHDGLSCQFCGKVCKNRNSLCNHERLCVLNPNRQQHVGFSAYNKARQTGEAVAWNKGLTKETDERVARNAEAIQAYYEEHPGTFKGRHHTKESRKLISKRRKDFLEANPDMVPYLLNHASKESYPETYFKELFIKNNIDLVYHHRIHTYELDFCNIDRRIDIEIDGEQHYLDPRIIESDKRRSKFLEDLGWKVYRIRWSEYQSMDTENRHKVISDIVSLLK